MHIIVLKYFKRKKSMEAIGLCTGTIHCNRYWVSIGSLMDEALILYLTHRRFEHSFGDKKK